MGNTRTMGYTQCFDFYFRCQMEYMPQASKNKRLDKIPIKYRAAVEADMVDIVVKLKKQRVKKKIVQEELAEMLQVDPTTIQGIEQQRVRPSIELLLAMIKVLEMKIVLS